MMEVKVNVEINISEATQRFIAQLVGAPMVISVPPELIPHAAVADALDSLTIEKKPEPKPKKPAAKKEQTLEEVKEVITPKEEPAPAAEPVKEAKKEISPADRRKEVKAFCASRKAEGVNIPKLVHDFLGNAGAKFSQIPDERLEEFYEIVKAAEVE